MSQQSITHLGQLATQLEALAASAEATSGLEKDDKLRARVAEACRSLHVKLEAPLDTVSRLIYSPLIFSVARLGVKTGLWAALSEAFPGSISLPELAQRTGMQSQLLARLLRYCVVNGFVDRLEGDGYRATNVALTLSTPYGVAGINFGHLFTIEPLAALPDWLLQHNLQEPEDPEDAPFALGKGIEPQGAWKWMQDNPDALKVFNNYVDTASRFQPMLTVAFPLEKYVDLEGSSASSERIEFVDVGGGNGQICESLLLKYPQLRNRIVLENLGDLSTHDPKNHPGYSFVPQNFFERQIIRGARVYYVREIMHDWPDKHCIDILVQLRDALAEDSVILVDDIVMSWETLHWREVANDILVMCALAAKERSAEEWDGLFKKAGLQRKESFGYDAHGRTVQVVVPV